MWLIFVGATSYDGIMLKSKSRQHITRTSQTRYRLRSYQPSPKEIVQSSGEIPQFWLERNLKHWQIEHEGEKLRGDGSRGEIVHCNINCDCKSFFSSIEQYLADWRTAELSRCWMCIRQNSRKTAMSLPSESKKMALLSFLQFLRMSRTVYWTQWESACPQIIS